MHSFLQDEENHGSISKFLQPKMATISTQAADEAYEEEAKQLADVEESEATFLDLEESAAAGGAVTVTFC